MSAQSITNGVWLY